MLKNKMLSAMGGAPANYIEDVFSTWLYTGNGSTQTITNGIDLAGKGGLVWVKARSTTANHGLSYKSNFTHFSNLTDAETGPGVTFNSNGFTTAANGTVSNVGNGVTHASWTFRKQPKFFDVVTWTGNGVLPRIITHNLGSVPGCVIIKRTDSTSDWSVYHKDLRGGVAPWLSVLYLNTTAAQAADGSWMFDGPPTDTTLSLRAGVNVNGATYVAYLFAHNAGGFGLTGTDNVISCGSFAVNSSGSLVTQTLGYEPQFLIFKNITNNSGNTDWQIYDAMRGAGTNLATNLLYANTSGVEGNNVGGVGTVSVTATGFTWKDSSPNNTYIYIAIRRGPMKTPTSGTKVFAPIAGSAGSTIATTGFPSDLAIQKVSGFLWENRLVGDSVRMDSSSTSAETTANSWRAFTLSSMNLMTQTYFNNLITPGIAAYALRRAPGFFDQVCYTGTGVARTVAHNLTVVPELMIVKRRDTTSAWNTYVAAIGNTNYLAVESTAASTASSTRWNNTSPTSTQFTVGTFAGVNASGGTYVAYLFASCPGVSKVFNFTGTGTTQIIDCGFTAGARFVLIKRTDSTGDWYVWDSARGIVSGNEPYLLLNSAAAEVTGFNFIAPASAGFVLVNSSNVNLNGASYIGLAIA